MKRIVALVLVVAMGVQASGCTTSFPAQPRLAVAADVPTKRAVDVAEVEVAPVPVRAAPVRLEPPTVPTSEFLGGPAGMIVGVALLGAMALALSFAKADN